MKKTRLVVAFLVVSAAAASLPTPVRAQETLTDIVFETGFGIENANLSGWIQDILANLGADGFEEAAAQFVVFDTYNPATGQIIRTAQIQVYITIDGETNYLFNYFMSYDWETGEIVDSETNGIDTFDIWSDSDEYFLFNVQGELWGAVLDLNVYWGWFASVTANLFDAEAEGAAYLRSELDLVVDVSSLLIGIDGVLEVKTEFNAKPVQLRARLLLNALQGIYFKLYYDLPMTLKIDVDVLWSLVSINVLDESWNFSWKLLDRQLVSWLEPNFP